MSVREPSSFQNNPNRLLDEVCKGKSSGYFYYILNPVDRPNEIWFSVAGGFKNDPNESVPPSHQKDFYRCLSYLREESVAMWKIYAEKGCCLHFTKALIENIDKYVESLTFCEKVRKPLKNLKASKEPKLKAALSSLFYLEYVYYIRHFLEPNKKCDCVKRSTFMAHMNEKEFRCFQERKFLKSMCWDYECEARLCIRYDVLKKLYPKYVDRATRIIVKLKPNKVSKIAYYKSPLKKAKYPPNIPWEDSKLKGHVQLNKPSYTKNK